MTSSVSLTALIVCVVGACCVPPGAAARRAEPLVTAAAAPALAFGIEQGSEINRFVRSAAVAAHLVVRAGRQPRIIVAFPAGDSGVGLWFAPVPAPVNFRVPAAPHLVQTHDAQGRVLRGIAVTLSVAAPRLPIRQVILSSVRVLRDYEASGHVPAAVASAARMTSPTRLVWERNELDGSAGYRLSIEVLNGGRVTPQALIAGSNGVLQLRLQALCGAPALTPLRGAELLVPASRAAPPRDRRESNVLSFLSYRQKFLAGSWRFDTYFGRDTLISLTLLMPVLQPAAIDSGLQSVLQRLSRDGAVAHEEAIGEYAMLLHLAAGGGPSAAPLYDYSMLDEDFLLAPLAARWLLDDARGVAQAVQFLAARNAAGAANGALLVRNLTRVVRRTAPFAASPLAIHLIGLPPGQRAGDWRDSPDGLDGGRYPYDVNVALVPAALAAVARLVDSGLLAPYLSAAERALLSSARAQRRVWLRSAPPLFTVREAAAPAAASVRSYAVAIGVPPAPALAALQQHDVVFQALALDASGQPLPIMHSDESLRLLLDEPSAQDLGHALDVLMRPFPAGLMTGVGLLVANPVYADREARARFTSSAYHGTVIWAWQEAVLAAGLDRQLLREDLPAALRERLRAARTQLWDAIDATRALRASELWSWSYRDGHYSPEAFQPLQGEADSDAAQLWSTVFLALTPPVSPRLRGR